MRRLTNIVAITVAAMSLSAVAYASSGEHAFTGPHNISATAINPQTCRFLHPEVDPATGPTWRQLRGYSLYEDARHDAKMNCLNNLVQKLKTKITTKATLEYKSVYATGTGETVTAQCPAGYYVSGGGSHSEVTGSYPTGNDAWVVARDHLSPRVLDVTAICIRVAS